MMTPQYMMIMNEEKIPIVYFSKSSVCSYVMAMLFQSTYRSII
jgi:hypothetical protein